MTVTPQTINSQSWGAGGAPGLFSLVMSRVLTHGKHSMSRFSEIMEWIIVNHGMDHRRWGDFNTLKLELEFCSSIKHEWQGAQYFRNQCGILKIKY